MSHKTRYPTLSQFANRRVVAILFMSFASGLPIILVSSTLQAWYTVAGMNLVVIGSLSLIGQPYVYKFLWAPLMDRFAPLALGRRRGWIVLMQIGLTIGLLVMSLLTPQHHPWWLFWIAFIVAVCSASQDIAIDAYRTDILRVDERGFGAGINTLGYRLAMLVSGALAIIIAAEYSWHLSYLLMAVIMAIEIGFTLLAPRPPNDAEHPRRIVEATAAAVHDYFSRRNAVIILVFILIYKLTDAFGVALNTAFLIRGLGFSLVVIGSVYKVVSLVATLLGSIVGGVWMTSLGMYRALMIFGLLQALSNLTYMILAVSGKHYLTMVAAVFTEYFCGGLSTVAFVAFLMSLCNRRFSATQYALLSAISAVGRVYVGPLAAVMVDSMGWAWFYFVTFLIGLPALWLLYWLNKRINLSVRLIGTELNCG